MPGETEASSGMRRRVAFITGAGRGQGRSHALALAARGADIALVDMGSAGKVETPPYRTASRADLDAVAAEVQELGSRALVLEADVRDLAGMQEAADRTVAELGRIDYVVANAGITDRFAPTWEIPAENWSTMIDINLTGVFNTCRATIPHMLQDPDGRAVTLIGSGVGVKPVPHLSHYVAAKAGLRALGTALAAELGPYGIRCNAVHPAGIDTEMTTAMVELNGVPRADLLQRFRDGQLIARNVEIRDVTAAVVWLLSPESRSVTGLDLMVDAGESKK